MAKAVCTAAVSPLINALSIYFLIFLFFHLNRKKRKSLPIYSFTSPWSCDSNLHLILLQYSDDTGDMGSCSEQQRRPSSAEGTRAPFSWSLQKERGQNSQKETAAPLHSLHWCHGHSHFPYGGWVRLRHRRWYALGQSFLSHMTSSPPSPHWKQ